MLFRKYSPTLVLRKFEVNAAATTGALIEIVGRPSGILGWLLTVIGLASETTLTVTGESVCVNNASLAGQSHHIVPLPHVSHSSCGYVKPIGYIIAGFAAFFGSIFESMVSQRLGSFSGRGEGGGGGVIIFIGLVILIVCCIRYFYSKKMTISVVADSGWQFPLVFQRSVMEGVSVDMPRAMEVINLLNGLITRAAH